MPDRRARQQVKILSLTIRILLISGRITQMDLVRAARIAAADVRSERPREPETEISLNTKASDKREAGD